jgi:lysophospholipase L1-like esterase
VDVNASRSSKNYAHQLAARLGVRLTDVSAAGSTTLEITSERQTLAPSKTVAPQINALPHDADVVLITTGGNDIGYIGGLVKDAIRATWIGWFLFLILWLLPLPKSTELTDEQLADRIGAVLDAVHATAPQARVFLVEYLALLGDDDGPARQIGLSDTQIAIHKRRAERISTAYALASAKRSAWTQVVPMHEKSKAHAIGSAEPWVEGFTLYDVTVLRKVPFHPNLAGMTATADVLEQVLA